jgi:hypothetical protein
MRTGRRFVSGRQTPPAGDTAAAMSPEVPTKYREERNEGEGSDIIKQREERRQDKGIRLYGML